MGREEWAQQLKSLLLNCMLTTWHKQENAIKVRPLKRRPRIALRKTRGSISRHSGDLQRKLGESARRRVGAPQMGYSRNKNSLGPRTPAKRGECDSSGGREGGGENAGLPRNLTSNCRKTGSHQDHQKPSVLSCQLQWRRSLFG